MAQLDYYTKSKCRQNFHRYMDPMGIHQPLGNVRTFLSLGKTDEISRGSECWPTQKPKIKKPTKITTHPDIAHPRKSPLANYERNPFIACLVKVWGCVPLTTLEKACWPASPGLEIYVCWHIIQNREKTYLESQVPYF